MGRSYNCYIIFIICSYEYWHRVFWNQQSISITLPLLIAITALARFIILQGKEMDPTALVYEAIAIVLIAGAIVILRLRHSDKLGLKKKKSK